MRTEEVAAKLGCHINQVTHLLRTGVLKGKRVLVKVGTRGFQRQEWRVDRRSVETYAKREQTVGWKRGRKRSTSKR